MPGANAKALEKAKTLAADVLLLDLEDSVAPEAKADARAQVAAAVKAGGYGKREVIVRVNALAPGLVATGMTKGWLDDPEMRNIVIAGSQLGRPAEPEEIAGMVLYLTSDLASFATGGVYVVDGGQTAH